jgi:hypothetical protein
MIELLDYRIRWDGAHNYVLEQKAFDKEGNYKEKDGEQVYNKQTYYGGSLPHAVAALYRRCITAEFNDIEFVGELRDTMELYQTIISQLLQETDNVVSLALESR